MVQIIKLGGSILTDKTNEATLQPDVLDRLANELATTDDELVLVHGAGSYGHPGASRHDLADGISSPEERAGFAKTHADVRRLNLHVLDALHEAGIDAVTFAPFSALSSNDASPGGWNLVPLHKMLGQDLLPVTHGDLVLDTMRGVSVLSGDRIVAELARFFRAERVVFALDQDGVYTHPPNHQEAQLLDEPSLDELQTAYERATEGQSIDVTGGMSGKLACVMDALKAGSEVCLVNGLVEDRLADALAGTVEGTRIKPEEASP